MPLSDPPAPTLDATALRVLRAARDEVIAHGLGDASIDRIAARAGASKHSIYSRYPARLDLFREALRLTVAEASQATRPDTTGLAPEAALIASGEWMLRSIRDPVNLALYRADIVAAERFPDLSAELHAVRSRTPALVDFMAAIRHPIGLADQSPERLARWFGVLTIGGLHDLLGLPASPALDAARIAEAAHLFAHGWDGCGRVAPRPGPSVIVPLPEKAVAPPRAGRTAPARWTELLRLTATEMIAGGIRNTGIDALSARTGIAKMTIYRQFDSKEGLAESALCQLVDDLQAKAPFDPADDDPVTTLNAVARDHGRRFARPAQLGLLRLLVGEAVVRPALVRKIWARLMDRDRRALARWLERRRDAGDLQILDPAIAAEQFLLLAAHGNRLLSERDVLDGMSEAAYRERIVGFFLRDHDFAESCGLG